MVEGWLFKLLLSKKLIPQNHYIYTYNKWENVFKTRI